MSSNSAGRTDDPYLYEWSAALDPLDYVVAEYEITASRGADAASLAMAMEQSVGATRILDYFETKTLAPACIRVMSVTPMGLHANSAIAPFELSTRVYAGDRSEPEAFRVRLAVPLRLLSNKPAQLWNILVGELPRLGFINRFRLIGAPLPVTFGPGPSFGVEGLREAAGVLKGPLLCRSMRPAVGLGTAAMARLNLDVLVGGFHAVKDDELSVFASIADFSAHITSMIAARDAARRETGERKLYFANLICEPWELMERWDLCCQMGVDGVLVAPWIQGLGTLAQLAREQRMPVIAHNTIGELFTRHPDWGVDDAVLVHWLRVNGADLFVTAGDFGDAQANSDIGTRQISMARATFGSQRAMMPILQGGKSPDGLPRYHRAVGSDDFMLIVASWIDQHHNGPAGGAREFRAALNTPRP
jgi:ribulose-bisphosphate carboxylase large chain